MKTIPARSVIDYPSIQKLNELWNSLLENNYLIEFFAEFNSFFFSSEIIALCPGELDKKTIEDNPILRNLVDRSFSGKKNITIHKSQSLDTSKILNKYPPLLMNLLFSTSKEPDPINNRKWLRMNSLPNSWKKFSNNRVSLVNVGGKKSEFKSWEDFGIKGIPISSLVIFDPYLFKEKELMLQNLPRLINGMVDFENVEIPIKIVFVVGGDVNKSFPPTDFISKRNQELKDLIEKEFSDRIEYSVVYLKNSFFHERCILSNYFYMTAGKGFNFYTTKGEIDQKTHNTVTTKFLSDLNSFKEFRRLVDVNCALLLESKKVLATIEDWKENDIVKFSKGMI